MYTTSLVRVQPRRVSCGVPMPRNTTRHNPNGYGEPVAKFSVGMPEDLLRRIDAAWKENGYTSRSQWLCLAAEQKIAGTLRSDDRTRLEELDERVTALEERLR